MVGSQFAIRNLQFKIQGLIALGILIVATACQATGVATSSGNVWTGFLEGKTLNVSPEVGGRIVKIVVKEGEVVQPGQLLATLDDELIRLRVQVADANIVAAQAQLDLIQAGSRNEDLRKAETRVAQTQAALTAAATALADVETIRANPQTLGILKSDAEARALAAQQQLLAAAYQAHAADFENYFWQEQTKMLEEGVDITLPSGARLHFDSPGNRIRFAYEEWNKAGNRAWQAWAAVQVAEANANAAHAALRDVSDQIANPLALDTRVNQARAARDRAAAGVQAAQAALKVLRDGASDPQIETARAALDQTKATRATLEQELARYTITAPSGGTVTRVAFREGEVIAPATPLVRLNVDGDLKLRVFVPMAQIEKIKPGINALVTTETPALKFDGVVANVAERAEFAGRIAQTDDDRNAQLVAVEVTIKQPGAQLKPGMTASAIFGATPGVNIPAPTPANAPALNFSGTLETKITRIAPELGGRVVAVRVQRGEAIRAGEPVIELDDATIKTTLSEAQAAVRAAQANLDQVNEKARPGILALADAGITQADAELQAAQTALADAKRALATPQDILTQVHQSEQKVRAAQGEVTRATAALESVKQQLELAERDQSFSGKTRAAMLIKQRDAAAASLAAAQITLTGSERTLKLYRELQARPLELIAAQHAAENQIAVAQASKQIAQVEQEIAKRGAQSEAVALAQARLRAAQASLHMVEAQAKRFVIASPLAGTITGRSVEPGEAVRAGVPLITVADARELELTVYVPAQNLGAIQPGAPATLRLPSLPGKTFPATVSYIASEAEFKPANIYNSKERSEMVFSVRVVIPNASGELKAGLPGDVMIGK